MVVEPLIAPFDRNYNATVLWSFSLCEPRSSDPARKMPGQRGDMKNLLIEEKHLTETNRHSLKPDSGEHVFRYCRFEGVKDQHGW